MPLVSSTNSRPSLSLLYQNSHGGGGEADLVIWCVFCVDHLCCLIEIFAFLLFFFLFFFFWVSVGIFRRFHWEFTKVFMCVVWLIGFLLVFLGFYWFWKYIFLVMFSEEPSMRFWYPFLYFYRGLGVFELLLCWFFWYIGIICKRCSWRFFWLVRQREGRERPENERKRETREERITNGVCIFRNKSYLLRTKFVGFKMFWM